MKIRGLELDLFGPHLHTRMQELPDGLVVIYGPNEAGKSSLLAAIRGALFGRAAGLEPDLGAQAGSRVKLTLETASGELSIERPLGSKRPPKLLLPDGRALSGESDLRQLVPALRTVDESIYGSVFTFQLAELNDLSDHSDVASLMYTAGLMGNVSPLGIEQELYQRARAVFNPNPRARKQPLNECLTEIKRLKRELAAANDKPEDYLRTQSEVESLRAELAQLAEGKEQVLQAVNRWQKQVELLPVHRRILALEQQLENLGEVPDDDPYDLMQLTRMNEEVQRMKEAASALAASETDMVQQKTQLNRALQRLAPGWTKEALLSLRLDESQLVKARSFAEDWRSGRQHLNRLKEQLEDSELSLKRAASALTEAGLEAETAAETIARKQSALVERKVLLEADRDRLQRLERLSAQVKSRVETTAAAQSTEQSQAPAGPRLVLGLVLLLSAAAAVWQRADLVGVVTGLAGLWLLFAIEQRLFRNSRKSGGAAAEAPVQAAEQAELDRLQDALVTVSLPKRALELSQADWQDVTEALRHQERAADAQERTLQTLLEVWKRWEEENTQAEQRRQAVDSQERRMSQIEDDYTAFCSVVGAPVVEPPDALPAEFERVQSWQSEVIRSERTEARLNEQRNRLFNTLTLLEQTCAAMVTAIVPAAESQETAAAHETLVGAGETVEARIWKLEQQLAGLTSVAEPAVARVRDERNQRAALREQWNAALNQAAGICGSRAAYEEAALALADWSPEGLEAELAQHQAERSRIEGEERTLLEQLGAKTSVLSKWSSTVSADLGWALSEASAERADLAHQWAVLTLTQALVREAREQFETDRQPAVLAAAGEMLADWTGGRYQRLLARADASGQPQLLCVDAAGEAWEPKRLSRGTREQIYLCLRFAMIADYGQKGALLPVILDDPMVNFDGLRLAQALRFVSAQAETVQTIYFTCQDHVAREAAALNATVFELTGREEKRVMRWEDTHGQA